MKIPLPSPDERAAREREAQIARVKENKAGIEQLDARGAVLTLLSSVGIAHKHVPMTDVPDRQRIEAIAVAILDSASQETLGVKSAQRMVDRLIASVDEDWAKRGLK